MVLLWVLCVFVSILVHEYGHALMSRAFGFTPSIVLWGMGGLCYSQGERQSPRERLAVVLAGPGRGLCSVPWSCCWEPSCSGSRRWVTRRRPVPSVRLGRSERGRAQDRAALWVFRTAGDFAFHTYQFLVFINLFWGLLNLLPIWPLDGGQAAQILLSLYDRHRGQRWGHVVSLLVAGGLALVSYQLTKDLFLTVFFGYFAFVNFQVLQTLHQAHSMGLYEEDEWWRKVR